MRKIKLQRLGIVLAPKEDTHRTTAKFNAGMAIDGERVHMVYRYAVWKRWYNAKHQSCYAIDQIRYAQLAPTGQLLYESVEPLIVPSKRYDASGCQDPRIVRFEGEYYLFYCGWDKEIVPCGEDRARVCIARTRDFKTCLKLGSIDHYTWDKDAFIFPERIGDSIAYMHRVESDIQIDYFSSFEELLDAKSWTDYKKKVKSSKVLRPAFPWEREKIGGSVPPIRTDKGWLLIYHGVESSSGIRSISVYRAGAALLSLDNPSDVVARLPYPILEPEEEYERNGDVNNVVFPMGGYIYNGELYISYGGADRCIALAKMHLKELIDELLRHPVH